MADRDNIIADSRHQRGTQLLFAKRYYPVLVSKRSRIRILSIERQWANILFFGHRLTFNFVPKLLLVYCGNNIVNVTNLGAFWNTPVLLAGAESDGNLIYTTYAGDMAQGARITWGQTIKWYCQAPSGSESQSTAGQLNVSGVTYRYVALG